MTALARWLTAAVIAAGLANGSATEHEPRAATYHVSTRGSDAAPGTRAEPFATLARAAAVVLPGDTVLVRGGVYRGALRLSRSGTASSPITFQASPGEIPIIDGEGQRQAEGLVRIDGSYVTLKGFEIRNSGVPGRVSLPSVFVDGTHVAVEGNHIHHGSAPGVRIWTPRGASHARIEHNHIHHMDDGRRGGADCVALGGAPPGPHPLHHPRAGNVVVRENLLHHCSDDGVDTWDVSGNLIEGNVVFANGTPGWATGIGRDGNGLKLGGDGPGGFNVVRHNVVYSNARRGIVTNGSAGNLVYSNTAFRNVGDGVQATGLGRRAGDTGNRFFNNLSLGNGRDFVRSAGSGTLVQASNSWNLGVRACRFVSTVPPRLPRDLSDFRGSGFLELSPGSACIDRGTADIPGEHVSYQGKAPDLGAYEAR